MPLYVYEKATPTPPPPPPVPSTLRDRFFYFIPLIMALTGLLMISFVVWPIISYELNDPTLDNAYSQGGLLNPFINSSHLQVLAAPKLIYDSDFTQITSWFPTATLPTSPNVPIKQYTLSIPKFKIKDATVRSDTTDLSQTLAQYPGTALPGTLGAPVVFGHSILPQFFNPKNYLSIFSLLPTIQNGDEIIVDYDGVTYTYLVSEKLEVYPQDVWVLQQDYDQKRLKLITCVPPGLKTKRLVVTATLKP